LPNEAFGFLRVTVERPLRVHYEVNDDTLTAVETDKTIGALQDTDRATILDTVHGWSGMRFDFASDDLKNHVRYLVTLVTGNSRKIEKAILDVLTVRGDDDPIVTRKGTPEPDPYLRDQENVPQPVVSVTYEAEPTGRLAMTPYRQA